MPSAVQDGAVGQRRIAEGCRSQSRELVQGIRKDKYEHGTDGE